MNSLFVPPYVIDGNDVVAWRQQCEERVTDRCHAAREAGGRLGTFQFPHLFFEGGDCGIGVSAVDMSRFLAFCNGKPFVEIRVAVGDAVRDRDLGGVHPMQAVLARPDSESPWSGHG